MLFEMIVILIIGFLFYQLQISAVWETAFFKVLRWILFIPISFILLGFVLATPNIFFNLIFDLAWWKIILLILFLVGFTIMFFESVIFGGIGLVLNLCPSKKVSSVSTIIIGTFVSLLYISFIWTTGNSYDINYRSVSHSSCVTIANLVVLGMIIYYSVDLWKEDNSRVL